MINIQKRRVGEADKYLLQNIFIFSRMSIEGYIVVFMKIYIYFIVIYSLENCHRLNFSIEESYVYYEFIRLY